MRNGTLFLVAYCVGVGIYLEKKHVPETLLEMAKDFHEALIRRNVRIAIDEAEEANRGISLDSPGK
jgi:hypothetical protein